MTSSVARHKIFEITRVGRGGGGGGGGGGGVVVYQYTRKKFAKPYTRFKKPLYTVHPKTLADPG